MLELTPPDVVAPLDLTLSVRYVSSVMKHVKNLEQQLHQEACLGLILCALDSPHVLKMPLPFLSLPALSLLLLCPAHQAPVSSSKAPRMCTRTALCLQADSEENQVGDLVRAPSCVSCESICFRISTRQ